MAKLGIEGHDLLRQLDVLGPELEVLDAALQLEQQLPGLLATCSCTRSGARPVPWPRRTRRPRRAAPPRPAPRRGSFSWLLPSWLRGPAPGQAPACRNVRRPRPARSVARQDNSWMPAKNPDLHGNVPDKAPVALVLIDVINDLEFPGGDRLARHALPMARRLAALKARARGGRDPRHLRERQLREVAVGPDPPPRAQPWARTTAAGPWSSCCGPADDDYFVLKPKHSGFFSTTLDILVRVPAGEDADPHRGGGQHLRPLHRPGRVPARPPHRGAVRLRGLQRGGGQPLRPRPHAEGPGGGHAAVGGDRPGRAEEAAGRGSRRASASGTHPPEPATLLRRGGRCAAYFTGHREAALAQQGLDARIAARGTRGTRRRDRRCCRSRTRCRAAASPPPCRTAPSLP